MKTHKELSSDLLALRRKTWPANTNGRRAMARDVALVLVAIQGHPYFKFAVAAEGSYEERSSAAQRRSAGVLSAKLTAHAAELAAVIRGEDPGFDRYDVLGDLGKAVAEIREVERRVSEGALDVPADFGAGVAGDQASRLAVAEAEIDALWQAMEGAAQ